MNGQINSRGSLSVIALVTSVAGMAAMPGAANAWFGNHIGNAFHHAVHVTVVAKNNGIQHLHDEAHKVVDAKNASVKHLVAETHTVEHVALHAVVVEKNKVILDACKGAAIGGSTAVGTAVTDGNPAGGAAGAAIGKSVADSHCV